MIGCGGTRMSGMIRFTGIGWRCFTSAPVTTATTPGARRAASTSSLAMRAWAWGERSSTTWAQPGGEMSST